MSIAVWNTSLCILTCFQSFWEVSTIQNWMPIGLRLLIAFGLFTLLGWWFALWFLCLSSLPWCFSLQCYWQLDQVESCLAYLAKHGGILQHFLVFAFCRQSYFGLRVLSPAWNQRVNSWGLVASLLSSGRYEGVFLVSKTTRKKRKRASRLLSKDLNICSHVYLPVWKVLWKSHGQDLCFVFSTVRTYWHYFVDICWQYFSPFRAKGEACPASIVFFRSEAIL